MFFIIWLAQSLSWVKIVDIKSYFLLLFEILLGKCNFEVRADDMLYIFKGQNNPSPLTGARE